MKFQRTSCWFVSLICDWFICQCVANRILEIIRMDLDTNSIKFQCEEVILVYLSTKLLLVS
jgi:hypothetical protein